MSADLNPTIDLTNCDQEPIHVPGSIQPHGVLLACDEQTLTITHVSDSIRNYFGLEASSILNKKITSLIEPSQHEKLDKILRTKNFRNSNPVGLTLHLLNQKFDHEVILHSNGKGQIIFEIEFNPMKDTTLSFSKIAWSAISRLKSTRTLAELYQVAVEEMRSFTGFNRVVLYKFDHHWNGEVVAESVDEGLTSLMGLWFPASDIPAQARELYRKNLIRSIPTVDYEKSIILSQSNDPLDLSFSVLRNVSPIHIEYLHNMGVSASLSVSIVKDNELWGLISCSHEQGPKFISYEQRQAGELLGEMTASLIEVRQANEFLDYRVQLKSTQSTLLQFMSQEKNFVHGLLDKFPNLLSVTGAEGAAVYLNGEYSVTGITPGDEELEEIVAWLQTMNEDEVFHTDSLSDLMPGAERFKATASGLIAASLSNNRKNFVLWFRPEVTQSINWGGDPRKNIEKDETGSYRIHPRKSFDKWKEIVHNHSIPWLDVEIDSAKDFRHSVIDIILQKGEELSKLNTDLERSNLELDSFAYAASHDLKEPLRGIHNYTYLIERELGDLMDHGQIRGRLGTIVKLTQRMENLINSLLHYAQVGRTEFSLHDVDLHLVLEETLSMLEPRLQEENVRVSVPRRLPTVMCDEVRISEVFSNLLTNAVKYNDKSPKEIEVGWFENDGNNVFYVKDNGIGIRDKNFEAVFRIFKRLHKRDLFGGGNGTGLTIVKSIIERHGGKIWLESVLGQGSTFFFTLNPDQK